MNKLINFNGKNYVPLVVTVIQKFNFNNVLSIGKLIFGKPDSTHEDMNKCACLAALKPERIDFLMGIIL